jgi:cytidine deaminase
LSKKKGLEAECMLEEQTVKKLIKCALEQRKFSYAPYSNFCVGAALLAENGTVYTGCNIENGAYSPSNCAERTAFFKAVSEGVKEFRAICIVGAPKDETPNEFCPPCGVCRQVMLEFCGSDFLIVLAANQEKYQIFTLEELVPMGFHL